MRLRVALLLLACWAAPALGASQTSTRVDVYDDGLIQVWMPALSAALTLHDWQVNGTATVDAVSGATKVMAPDGVSGATRFSDRRNGANLGLRRELEGYRWVGVSGDSSVERDYRGAGLGAEVGAELLERTATLSLSVGLGGGVNLAEGLDSRDRVVDGGFSWVQILGPRTVATARLAGQHTWCEEALGCHASPYRYVALFDDEEVALAVRERHPSARSRASGGVQLSRLVGSRGALHASLSGSVDSWSVRGGTLRLAPSAMFFDERLVLWGKLRATRQQAASFAATETPGGPDEVPGYRTADRELGALSDHALGARAEWSFYGVGPLLRLGVELRADRLGFRYTGAPDVDAWLLGGGVNAEF